MTPSNAIQETLPVLTLAYYQIPEPNFPTLQIAIEKIARRCKRLGFPEVTLAVTGMKPGQVGETSCNILDVELKGMAPVVTDWKFVASLNHDHEAAGNIVKYTPPFVEADVDPKYRTVAPACDHCQLNRKRNDTYVVRNITTNAEKQVGRTCLGDFFSGKNPHNIAEYVQILGNVGILIDESKREPMPIGPNIRKPHFYPLLSLLARAAAIIRVSGKFVSGKTAYENRCASTADDVRFHLWSYVNPELARLYAVTPADEVVARNAITWAAEVDATNDYLWNIRTIANAEMATMKEIGLAVSIVGVFLRNQVPATVTPSQHVGKVDERVVVTARLDEIKPLEFSLLYKFTDVNGNKLSWFCKGARLDMQEGETKDITGTVYKHDEFRGVKQTTLGRVAIAKPGKPAPAKKAATAINTSTQYDNVPVPF